MCLTGRMMSAEEAERSGLIAKVVPPADLLDEALKTAEAIAAMPPIAAIAVKEMVNAAFEIPLGQGIRFERRLFHGLFGTEDQKEGMAAFVEKRPGNWKGRYAHLLFLVGCAALLFGVTQLHHWRVRRGDFSDGS